MTPQSKTSAKPQQRGKKEVVVFDLLKQDHDKVRDIFEQIEENEEGENREQFFSNLQSELQTHFQVEEKFFYPVLEQSEETRDIILQAYEEHNVCKTVLGEFSNLAPGDDRWGAKIKVLQVLVNHHIQEEEKNMFKMAKKVLEKEQIQEITAQIQQQKAGIQEKAA